MTIAEEDIGGAEIEIYGLHLEYNFSWQNDKKAGRR
jgi:hypothetical protein